VCDQIRRSGSVPSNRLSAPSPQERQQSRTGSNEQPPFFAPIEVKGKDPSSNVPPLSSSLKLIGNGSPNPRLQAPLDNPPQRAPQHYVDGLRRYHPEVTRQSITDKLFRESNPRNVRETLDRHTTTLRSFWDWKLGSQAKGKSGVGPLTGPTGSGPTTRLQQLILHRDKRALLTELTKLAQTPEGMLDDNQRARRAQLTDDLLTVLHTQRQELRLLEQTRGLTLEERNWSGLLDQQIARTAGYRDQLRGPSTSGSVNPMSLARDIQQLWGYEPEAISNISNPDAITKAAKHTDKEFDQAYRQSALRDVLLSANRERLLPLSESLGISGLPKNDRLTHKRYWKNLGDFLFRTSPRGPEAARRYLQRKQEGYSSVLKDVEKRGLLPELERRLTDHPPVPDSNALKDRPFAFKRGDGRSLTVTTGQIDAVLSDWKQEHREHYLETAKTFSKGWWTKVGNKIKNAFSSMFLKSDKADQVKGLTKAGENVVDTMKNLTEIKLEKGSEETSTENRPEEKTKSSLERRVKTLEKTAQVVGVVEHVGGIVGGVKQVSDKSKVIRHKLSRKEQGTRLMEEHERKLESKQGEEALTFKYRSGIMLHYGKALEDQTITTEAVEIGLVSGQVGRHGVQTTALGMELAGKSVATAGSMLVGGLGAAAVLEGGEALLAMIEAGKAGATKKELEEGAEKLRQEIIDKYVPGQGASIETVKKHLERLEKEYVENEEYLAKSSGSRSEDPEDELIDRELRESIESSQPQRKAQIESIKADLKRLSDQEALVKLLQDNQHQDVKTLVAVRSTVATAGYAMGFLVAIGAGGTALTIAAPVTMAVAGGAVLGVYAYKSVKSSNQQWRSDRATDAILGRADPLIVKKLLEKAEEQGIDPQSVALNLISSKDMRWKATEQLGKLKTECLKNDVRMTDTQIQERAGITDTTILAELDRQHQQAIYQASPTARFLHDVVKMPLEVIASIVDAQNDDEHDQVGRKLIEAYLDKEE